LANQRTDRRVVEHMLVYVATRQHEGSFTAAACVLLAA
jgi:hypothetical protein